MDRTDDKNMPLDKLLSCRHCYKTDSLWLKNGAGPLRSNSYVGMFVYGDSAMLLRMVENVERSRANVPGATVWCPNCRKNSMVSYAYHRACLLRDGLAEEEIMGAHEYYSRMCMHAEDLARFQAAAGSSESVSV